MRGKSELKFDSSVYDSCEWVADHVFIQYEIYGNNSWIREAGEGRSKMITSLFCLLGFQLLCELDRIDAQAGGGVSVGCWKQG